MRSKWSAELLLLYLATAALEGAWITLTNIFLAWLTGATQLSLDIVHFTIAVGAGMAVARAFRHFDQAKYAAILAAAAIASALIGAYLSGFLGADPGAFLRGAVVNPGVWLMGVAVLRGAAQSDPASGYESERVFSIGVVALVGFWVVATGTLMTSNATFTSAAFSASLTFISAGLLALGLGRLRDLNVEAVDRAARRRWLALVLGIVGLVVLIGIPLAGVLGLPVSSVIYGVLGPLAPILFVLLTVVTIPIFAVLTFLIGLLIPGDLPQVTPGMASLAPGASAAEPTPLPQPVGPAPDLTWLLIAVLFVGALVLLKVLSTLMSRPQVDGADEDAIETRASEPIALPHLPRIRRPRLRAPRRTPRTATEAYVLSLAALGVGPHARLTGETPREHALRIATTRVGRDVGRLATAYQLDEMAGVRLTARETNRAMQRWRRIVGRSRS